MQSPSAIHNNPRMLQEKKIMIASRLKKTIDTSNGLLCDINKSLERIVRDNEEPVMLSAVFKKWVDKVEKT